MAKEAKLTTDLGHSTESIFSDEVNIIINTTTKNVLVFPGLPVAMSVLGGALKTYNDARLAPVYDSQAADVKAGRIATQKIVTKNGNWFNDFCNGDLSLLKKTGYPMQKDAEAQGKLDATDLTLTNVIGSGNVEFFISLIKGSGIHYGIMFTTADNKETDKSKWTFYYAGQREGTMKMLEKDVDYQMVSFALGTVNDLTYSEIVYITAL